MFPLGAVVQYLPPVLVVTLQNVTTATNKNRPHINTGREREFVPS